MLVLSRKKNEAIVIDNAIVVTVVDIQGDKIRLGIVAPREIPVHRSEVQAVIDQQKALAAQLATALPPPEAPPANEPEGKLP